MPDYQKGKIYKLWSPQGTEDEIYFGSTIDDLRKRKSRHKCDTKCKSNILFQKYDDIRIEVIEEYPCNSKAELEKKEGGYIRSNKCLNKHIAGRTRKEYYQDNKEKIAEKDKKYRENNKEHKKDYEKNYYQNNKELIAEKKKVKVTCECGCIINKGDLAKHKKTPKHIKLMEENI
jgi:hypothetical protein